MSIFRRGSTWYASFTLQDGRRIKESLGTADKRLATELHDKRKAELWRVERLGDFPNVTFDDACMRWIQEKSDKKSIREDKIRMVFWLSHFEGVLLKDITERNVYSALSTMVSRDALRKWKMKCETARKKGLPEPEYVEVPVTQSTKARHMALLKSILRIAEKEWKWLEKAPNLKVNQPKNKRIRWLSPEEAQRLIDECGEPLKSAVKFALATGLRRSNIVNLEWDQIDMQRKVAWVEPEDSKSNTAIGVALNDTACCVLREQIGNHHKYVFVHKKAANRNDGTRTPAIRKMRVDDNTGFHSALKRAGIENFRFHDLRHTWASWLIQSGVPISVLQVMGGWESIEMVQRYAHLAPDHLTQHAMQIDAFLAGNVTNMAQGAFVELVNIA